MFVLVDMVVKIAKHKFAKITMVDMMKRAKLASVMLGIQAIFVKHVFVPEQLHLSMANVSVPERT